MIKITRCLHLVDHSVIIYLHLELQMIEIISKKSVFGTGPRVGFNITMLHLCRKGFDITFQTKQNTA